MSEINQVYSCCDKDPLFLITFSVAGEYKTYSVCESCEKREHFKKFVIKKVPIQASVRYSVRDLIDTVSGGAN